MISCLTRLIFGNYNDDDRHTVNQSQSCIVIWVHIT